MTGENLRADANIQNPTRMDDGRVGLVYMCQPFRIGANRQSARQFDLGATTKYQGRCVRVINGNTLLANNFNNFWAHALNMQEYGHDITHFVMLHDDIVPEDNWLDKLMADILATSADLVSAAVPIKDGRGLTSTAIDNPDDPFLVERRLTIKEVCQLPAVFSAADCGYPDRLLLANTGCWVCDFTKPWRIELMEDRTGGRILRSTLRFTVRDAIRYHEAAPLGARWQAWVAPEDWNFSRDVGRLGGRVMVTRNIRVNHIGEVPFSSQDRSAGWNYDRTMPQIKEPIKVVPQDIAKSEKLPDVRGWLSDREGEHLSRLARCKDVLEIGSYCGRSTIWLASSANHVHAVDTFDGFGTPWLADTYWEFSRNLDKYGVSGRISVLRGKSEEVIPKLPYRFDLVFIDGCHDLESVKRDCELALLVLRPGGLLVFHDYGSDNPDHEVTGFVDGLIDDGAVLVEQVGTLGVIDPGVLQEQRKPVLETVGA